MNHLNVILASLLLTSASIAPTLASPTNNIPTCAGDSGPCMARIGAKQRDNKVIFGWDGAGDFYNVRYQSGGRAVQKKIRSNEFTINNVQPNRVFEISVQACSSSFLSRSVCSDWLASSFTTSQEKRFNTKLLGQQIVGTTNQSTPIVVVGRVKLTNQSAKSICDYARENPASRDLQELCHKQKCEQAESARRRGSPAAPGLEAQCLAGQQKVE
jgi:hypothetical protein